MIRPERLVQTFMELVQIDSPSGEEAAMARDLARRLEGMGFAVRQDAYGNVIARSAGDGAAALLLSAHMDTVEPGRGIKPLVEGEYIRSDGTTILGGDSKAGVAAILEALASLHEEGAAHSPVVVVFTRQEEIGLVGARNLDFSLVTAREGVIFDKGGPVSSIVSASPTYMSFDVDIRGRAAHAGAEPERGLSAIRIAADIISGLPQGRIDEATTFNVGVIQGGSVRNAVPELASVRGEFRSRDPQALERLHMAVERRIEGMRAKYAEATVHLGFTKEFDGYTMAEDDPILLRVGGVLRTLDLEPDLGPAGGGTDANVMRQHGIDAIVMGMAVRDAHTVRESVHVPWLVDAARFCEALVKSS